MKHARLLVIVFVTLLTALLFWQANMPAQAKSVAPTCGGKDLLAELKISDAARYARIMAKGDEFENGDAIMWKVEKPGVAPSYLFGTIHVTDARVANLPQQALEAIKASKAVALELAEIADKKKFEQQTMQNLKLIAYLDGRSIETVLNPDQIARLKTVLKQYGLPYIGLKIMKPWFIGLSLALPPCEVERAKHGQLAVDEVVAKKGQAAGARIVGLETVTEQFAAFDALTIEEQKLFLLSSLQLHDQIDDQMETMKQLYLQRKLGALWELQYYLTAKYADGDKLKEELAVLERFQQLLVTKRNKVMVERAVPLIEEGKAFIAVGALHLPGKTGLVTMLRERGYSVTKVD